MSAGSEAVLYDIFGDPMAVEVDTAIPAGTALLIGGGSDGTNARYIKVDSSGNQVMIGLGTAGTPAGGVLTIQGDPAGTAIPISGTVTANAGSGNFSVVQAVAANLNATVIGTVTANIGTSGALALDATLAKLTITPSTAIGSNTLAMVGGHVTTVSPTYTNGNINPLSLTTAGALRIDGSAVTQPVSGTITANIGTTGGLALDATLTGGTQTTRITDGSNIAAVKAASTAAVATDPALVVAISPNNTVAVTQTSDTTPATQNITAQDVGSTTSRGANNQLIITGSPTANSTASFTLSSWETAQVQVTGTWTGALQVESSPDGGTTWYPRPLHQTAAGIPETLSFNANFLGTANVSGFTHVRVRSVTSWTGTATVRVVQSLNTSFTYIAAASPIGVEPAIKQADAFHRMRVSNPVRQWSSMSEYPDFPYLWETAVVGTGSTAFQLNQSSQRLSTGGTANNASAIRQTRRYMRYQPGKSSMVVMTFVMSAPQTNAIAEIGYYDASNGLFLQRSGSTLNIVRRTNVTGTPTDNIVAQSAWNLDRLDGTDQSGVSLDLTKAQILVIDYQWLGAGTARIGFDFGGVIGIVWAHQFINQNILSAVYMSTGCLPIRGRVFNNGVAGGTVTMDMLCTTYANEGAAQGRGVLDTDRVSTFSASNGTTTRTVGQTPVPVLSVRAATQYGGTGSGGQPNRGWIVPISANIYASAQDVYYEIWAGLTLTGASFAPFSTSSIADVDVSATAVASFAGAYRVVAGYAIAAKSGNSGGEFITPYEIPVCFSGLNSTQDTVTIVVTSLASGTNLVSATASWEERY